MGSARRTFLGMGAFSAVSLLLGVLRELVIARDLQAGGDADLFFRALAIVGASRAIALSVLRGRWIPLGPTASSRQLARRELGSCCLIAAVGVGALFVMIGVAAWREPTAWVFALAVILAVFGSIVRALVELRQLELRGYAMEWALPLGAIVGATVLGHGALGPAVGITAGLFVGAMALAPAALANRVPEAPPQPAPSAPVTRWLLLDTLAYVNLGLLDGALSNYVFAEGSFALLNYGYLFVNAALVVPSAALTIVSLRIAGARRDDMHARLRRWALLAASVVACAVLAAWAALAWAPVASIVDRAAGWSITEAIRPIVLCSVPFAALRLANTVGRQWLVAHDPRGLLPYDMAGLAVRTSILVFGATQWGVLASPIGLAAAELVQLLAWLRPKPHRPAIAYPPGSPMPRGTRPPASSVLTRRSSSSEVPANAR